MSQGETSMNKKTPRCNRGAKLTRRGAESQRGNVFPITKPPLLLPDEPEKRFILGIGNQRIAFDFTSRVTELPPAQLIEIRPRAATSDREPSNQPHQPSDDERGLATN